MAGKYQEYDVSFLKKPQLDNYFTPTLTISSPTLSMCRSRVRGLKTNEREKCLKKGIENYSSFEIQHNSFCLAF